MTYENLSREQLVAKLYERDEELNGLSLIINRVSDAFLALDKAWRYTYLNGEAERLFIVPKEEVINRCIWEVFPNSKDTEVYKNFHEAMRTQKPITFENHGLYTGRCFEVRLYPSPEGLSVFFTEITEHKHIEKELVDQRRKEIRLERFFKHSNDLMSVLDNDHLRFLSVNDSYLKLLGYTENDLIGASCSDYVHPEDTSSVIEKIKSIKETQQMTHTNRLRCKDGTYKWFEWVNTPIPEEDIICSVGRDITDRINVEEQQRKFNEQFYKAFNTNPTPSLIRDLTSNQYISVNDSFLSFLGYTRENVIGNTPYELYIAPREEENLLNILKEQGYLQNVEVQIYKKSGEIATILASASLIELDNKPHAFISFIDITQRKELELQLEHSNKRVTSIIESLSDGFFVLDKEWRYRYINSSLARASSKNTEEMLGKYFWEVYPEILDSLFYSKFQLAMSERTPVYFETDGFYSEKYYEIHVYPYDEGISVLVRDITEKRKYNQELARLGNFKLIGQMSAGISHEIRNPLTTVRGFLQILLGKDDCKKYHDYYDLMIQELDRANNIISEFLSISKTKAEELQRQNINPIVNALVPLICADALEQDKYLETDLQEVPDLLLDGKEIRQLLLNLCRNGLEAMSPSKWLTIRTYQDNDYVVLEVKDQGEGIPAEVLEKLGTPFFTTRAEGTGLGLSICYSIAARHNAELSIKTGPGGTTFYVWFKI